jgi:hypothetical protein
VIGRQDPSPTMIEDGYEGCGGWTVERTPTSGVVWKEAPESAIQLVWLGGSGLMVLKPCSGLSGIHPVGLG